MYVDMDNVKRTLIMLTLMRGSRPYEYICMVVCPLVSVDTISKQFGDLLAEGLIAFTRPGGEVRLTFEGFIDGLDSAKKLGFDRMPLNAIRKKIADWSNR